MIVNCYACKTRFKIPDGKVPPEGTVARCSRCRTTFWLHTSGDTEPYPPPENKVSPHSAADEGPSDPAFASTLQIQSGGALPSSNEQFAGPANPKHSWDDFRSISSLQKEHGFQPTEAELPPVGVAPVPTQAATAYDWLNSPDQAQPTPKTPQRASSFQIHDELKDSWLDMAPVQNPEKYLQELDAQRAEEAKAAAKIRPEGDHTFVEPSILGAPAQQGPQTVLGTFGEEESTASQETEALLEALVNTQEEEEEDSILGAASAKAPIARIAVGRPRQQPLEFLTPEGHEVTPPLWQRALPLSIRVGVVMLCIVGSFWFWKQRQPLSAYPPSHWSQHFTGVSGAWGFQPLQIRVLSQKPWVILLRGQLTNQTGQRQLEPDLLLMPRQGPLHPKRALVHRLRCCATLSSFQHRRIRSHRAFRQAYLEKLQQAPYRRWLDAGESARFDLIWRPKPDSRGFRLNILTGTKFPKRPAARRVKSPPPRP